MSQETEKRKLWINRIIGRNHFQEGAGKTALLPKQSCRQTSRSHYRAAELQQLLQDQEYLRCVKESEKGQTVRCWTPRRSKGAQM